MYVANEATQLTNKTIMKKDKVSKASELAFIGYSSEEIASALMLMFKMKYEPAKKLATTAYWYSTPGGTQN